MKLDLTNYEIVRAEGLSTIYFAPYDKTTKKTKVMDRLSNQVSAKCKKDMAKCIDKLTAKCKEDYAKVKDCAKQNGWVKASAGDPTPKYDMYKWPEDVIKNFGMTEDELEALIEIILNLKEEDDKDIEEMCDAKPCLTNADICGPCCCTETKTNPIEMSKEMLDMVSWGFNPTPGSFTVGHSLLQFGVPNANKDMIPTDKQSFYRNAIVGQASTWQHDQEIILGAICSAEIHYPSNILLLNTKFWESRAEVADLVETVKEKYNQKNLKFSFEILTAKVACSECGNEYPATIKGSKDHYCACLKGRFSPGSTVSRILTDFIPIGEGVVDVPAYTGSKSLIAAHQTEVARLAQVVEQLTNIIKNKIK